MTYREATQMQIAALQAIYDNAEWLRDCATMEEKEAWNNVRKLLPSVWNPLQKIDNKMSDRRASEEIGRSDLLLKVVQEYK